MDTFPTDLPAAVPPHIRSESDLLIISWTLNVSTGIHKYELSPYDYWWAVTNSLVSVCLLQ